MPLDFPKFVPMYKSISYFIVFFLSFSAAAQEHAADETATLMRRDVVAGLNFNTHGWGIAFFYGFQKNYKYKNTIGFTFTNIRHEKEHKIYGDLSNSKGYYYGKLNSLVSLRPTFGGKLVLFKTRRESGIEISAKWHLGPSLGLLKPVYLRIDKYNAPPVDERYDPTLHNHGNIASRSAWIKGLGDAKFIPGAFGKFAFDFDFSRIRSTVSGGEIGVMVDYFFSDNIELLYKNPTSNLFTCLYLQFNFGQKLY